MRQHSYRTMAKITHNLGEGFILCGGNGVICVRRVFDNLQAKIFVSQATSHYFDAILISKKQASTLSYSQWKAAPTIRKCLNSIKSVTYQDGMFFVENEYEDFAIGMNTYNAHLFFDFLSYNGDETLFFATMLHQKIVNPGGLSGFGANCPVVAFITN